MARISGVNIPDGKQVQVALNGGCNLPEAAPKGARVHRFAEGIERAAADLRNGFCHTVAALFHLGDVRLNRSAHVVERFAMAGIAVAELHRPQPPKR